MGVNHRNLIRRGLLLVAFFSISFVAGLYAGGHFNPTQAASFVTTYVIQNELPPEGIDVAQLWKVWKLLDLRYTPTSASSTIPSQEARLWGAIQGLTESYGDPYTVFFPPEESKAFTEDISGNFEGVGMEIGIRDGGLVIVAPLKDTPAERAGLQSGDKILRIDEKPTNGLSVEAAVKLIRGPRGTSVRLTILRDGEESRVISVTREVIRIPSLATSSRSDGIFTISLYNFSAISHQLFREALREFIESGSTKLLLDLRGNPGGFLESSVDMASWFLPLGKPVVIEDFGSTAEDEVYRSKGYDIFKNRRLKMAILINEGSASASEILAGALREHGVGKLIGQKSFGKGSVQELVDLGQGASLKITIAKWLTPNGISISEGGLTPDIEVKRTLEDVKAGKDPQMDAAVIYLLN